MKTFLPLIAAGLCLASAPALAQTAAAPAPAANPAYSARVITLAEAKSVVAAAEAESRKNGWAMVITIVESNGAVVLSEKMDGAQYGSSEVALKKAQTAANFRRPTSYFQEAVKSGTLNAIFTGAMALEGGELLLVDGKIVGAIGVSGGSAAQDGVVARAAATLK
ncbi:heme-binding protein [Caulobacter sp. BP25]|uniref:GlcG/HbpS family heme-binding protein n=1 Tax=Caulobacter sp. BP25 TaxID=2048900 RepID=UPI000C12B759|nr:heme-binding protein [Caulobacter sp. BP25]PHY17461.1 glcG protein [Caulobacter sp. BP25]